MNEERPLLCECGHAGDQHAITHAGADWCYSCPCANYKPTLDWGYPSDEPCRVCGGHNQNQSAPWFGYTVCREHQHVPPAQLP